MKLAVSIDNILTKAPKQLKQLMFIVRSSGYPVYILSEAQVPNMEEAYRMRTLQLLQIDIDHVYYDEVVLCKYAGVGSIALEKAEFCRSKEIDLVIEDNFECMSKIKELSPKTACLTLS